ncbi:MAG: restriction endonuclease subunit S [Burkholderiaceae bacterium]|jgi:type I restriction enzyme S subunit|nr:restriction endonuclease subunit S [Burkholderiaceae bacterium]
MSFDIATPVAWQQSSVSKYCHVQLGKMLQPDPSGDEDELLPYLRAISISKSGVDLSHQFSMWIKPHEKEKFRLKRNDVLVSEGGDAGRTAHFEFDGEYYFQNAINRVRPLDSNKITSRYLFYWFTFLKLSGYVDLICNVATIAHFTAEKVKAAPFVFPPLETQKRIAAFLDEKTARIDALIAKKQALLERLAEKRQAIITQAVTKGLNPAAPMKDSGIDWLGQIPAHWEVQRLKEVCKTIIDCKNRTPPQVDDGQYFVIRTSCLGNGEFDEAGGYWTDRESFIEWTRKGQPQQDDILISREAPIGEACLFPIGYELCLGQRMMLARVNPEKIGPEFLLWCIYSDVGREYVDLRRKGTTVGHLRVPEVFNFPVIVPPIEEQIVIVSLTRKQLAHSDQTKSAIVESIARLTEYRSALITAAVTGQMEINHDPEIL